MLVLANRFRLAVGIAVFTSSFVFRPFQSDEFSVALGLNGFLVLSVWLGVVINRKLRRDSYVEWDVVSPKLAILYLFLGLGIILSFFADSSILAFEYRQNLFQSVLTFSLFIVTAIVFIKTLVLFRNDDEAQVLFLKLFVLSSLIHLLNNIMLINGYESLLPKSFLQGDFTNPFEIRLAGLFFDYELIVDYSLCVIAFSLVLVERTQTRSYLIFIVVGALLGLASGTRSFLVISLIFFLMYSALNLMYYHRSKILLSLKILSLVTIFVLGAYYVLTSFLHLDVIFERFSTAVDLAQAGDYEGAANRPFSSSLPIILASSGVWGFGSMIITSIESDVLVFHNLYAAIFADYGILGLLALAYLIVHVITELVKVMRETNHAGLRREAIVYLSLFVGLLFQQSKITLTRDMSTILLYVFLLMNVYFLTHRFRQSRVQ